MCERYGSTRQAEFRVLYVANLPEAVYVLSAFEKKTRKTPQRDGSRTIGTPRASEVDSAAAGGTGGTLTAPKRTIPELSGHVARFHRTIIRELRRMVVCSANR